MKINTLVLVSVIFIVPLLLFAKGHYPVFNYKQELKLDNNISKVCWNELGITFFLWDNAGSQIHIYSNSQKINSIAEKDLGIQNITDIALAPDGNLFILDNAQKKVISIDDKGKKLSELEISSSIDPLLFCISRDEKIYVYDDYSQEVIVISNRGLEEFSFGGMQINEPQKMQINDQNISIYCEDNITYFYTKLGQFIQAAKGNCYSIKDNIFKLEKFFITDASGIMKLAVSTEPFEEFFYESPNLILIKKGKIITGDLKYEKK